MRDRRTILRGLAALSLASVPAVAMALPAVASAVSPDVALIAQAAKVEALAVRVFDALTLAGDLDLKAEDMEPDRPKDPLDVFFLQLFDVDRAPDGTIISHRLKQPVDSPAREAYEIAKEQHPAAVKAWEAECEQLRRRVGVHAADRLHSRLLRRLEAATCDLTPMVPTTLVGLVAKARAAAALDPHGDHALNSWEHDLRLAVVRDVIAIGGAA